tara:strand:+ start:758 stop:1504 length:747 start_codon:yes stop_codon:yes gene_type:complete
MQEKELPRYQQLKELIIDKISSGALKPLERVPSENQLVKMTGVSRMTANRALRELNNEGYLDRKAGIGSFVSDFKVNSHLFEIKSIADEVTSRGSTYSSVILEQSLILPTNDLSRIMQINGTSQIFHIKMVHFEDSIPIQLEDRYVKRGFAPDFIKQDFSEITPSAYLSSISPLNEAEQVVSAITPSLSISELLQMKKDKPCLLITRKTWVRKVLVTYGKFYHPGDRYELLGNYGPIMRKKLSNKKHG